MNLVGRIVTRFQDPQDGLILGSLCEKGKGILKPSTVYEIRECLGELLLVEMGPSAISTSDRGTSPIDRSWLESIDRIIVDKRSYLTQEEAEALREGEE